jgi:hypothetical protein
VPGWFAREIQSATPTGSSHTLAIRHVADALMRGNLATVQDAQAGLRKKKSCAEIPRWVYIWGCWEPKRTFQRKNKLYGSIEAKQNDEITDQHSILCCGIDCILCRLLDGQRANASAPKKRGIQ